MTKWNTILANDNFIIDYDDVAMRYRVSYFDDNHFLEDCVFAAVPVRHGEWIEYQMPNIICCSKCDWGTSVEEKFF